MTEEIVQLLTLLRSAYCTIQHSDLRQRYCSNHLLEEIKSEKINAEQFAKANWFLAKRLYCLNRDKYDELILKFDNEGHLSKDDKELISAMRTLIKEEIAEQLEINILKED